MVITRLGKLTMVWYTKLFLHLRFSDIVHVYDGFKKSLNKLGELSGSDVPGIILSTEPDVMLNFVSDHTVEKHGFKIQYNAG